MGKFKMYISTLLLFNIIFDKTVGEESKRVYIHPSLFPNIGSPTIKFILEEVDDTSSSETPKLLLENTTLFWKVGDLGHQKDEIEKIVQQSGLTLTKIRRKPWVGQWVHFKISKHPGYDELKSFQKTNRIPGFAQLGNKDKQFQNIQNLIGQHGWNEFPFVFPAFVLPNDIEEFKTVWESSPEKLWILKPPGASGSRGIRMMSPQWDETELRHQKPLLVQKYLENPYLINGRKVEMRVYFVITSISPLRIYAFKESYNKLGFMEYSTDPEKLHDPCLHFRDYKGSDTRCEGMHENEDMYPDRATIFKYLEKDGIDSERLMEAIHDGIILSVLSVEGKILKNLRKLYSASSNKGFQFLCADYILDQNGKPWLLEINTSPGYRHSTYKPETLVTVLNLAGFRLPNEKNFSAKLYKYDYARRQRSEIEKQRKFVQMKIPKTTVPVPEMTILEELTTDDVRQLIIAEDELNRMGEFGIRIYPSENMGKYEKYINSKSNAYYGKLFLAWDELYSTNRQSGIQRLSKLSKTMFS